MEWCLNSVMYINKYVIYMIGVYVVYMPMTYIGKFVLGYFPYYFITWDTWYSYIMLFTLGLLQVICFFIFSFLNNRLKQKYLDSIA